MERAQAAEYLGVSVSTLDRFASQGRLTRGRAKRKTRPVTVFDEEELERLKAELEQETRTVKATATETIRTQDAIGFRLDPYYVGRLKEEGAKRGLSPGEYARKLVVQSLEETPVDRFTQELSCLKSGIAGVFYVLLVEKFGATQDEANEIVAAITS